MHIFRVSCLLSLIYDYNSIAKNSIIIFIYTVAIEIPFGKRCFKEKLKQEHKRKTLLQYFDLNKKSSSGKDITIIYNFNRN